MKKPYPKYAPSITTLASTTSSVPFPFDPSHKVISSRSSRETIVPISSTIPVNMRRGVSFVRPALDGVKKAWEDDTDNKSAVMMETKRDDAMVVLPLLNDIEWVMDFLPNQCLNSYVTATYHVSHNPVFGHNDRHFTVFWYSLVA